MKLGTIFKFSIIQSICTVTIVLATWLLMPEPKRICWDGINAGGCYEHYYGIKLNRFFISIVIITYFFTAFLFRINSRKADDKKS